MEIDKETTIYDEPNIETITPPPTVHQFQIALLDKMKKYGGGIEGVWKAIATNLKYEIANPGDITDARELKPRISIEAFRKQTTRLAKESPTNEKMSFGMRGNILLLMNILEILEIRTTADLLGSPLQKPNLQSLLIGTNVNVEALMEKIDRLNDTISLSMKPKPRIPYLKVCRDWEQILVRSKWIVDMPPIQENISWDYLSLINTYANQFPGQIKTAIYTCMLLNDYKEYFPKDILLHRYCETFINLSLFGNNEQNKNIMLAPLFLLYFFLLCQKRFLSIFMPQKKLADIEIYSPFIHIKHDMKGNEIKSDSVLKILDGKSLIEYIGLKNKEMQNDIKKILMLFEDNMLDITDKIYIEYIDLMAEIIYFFFSIYSSHVNYKESHLLDFMEKIKSLNDLYQQLSLGRPQVYFISEDHINSIISFKQRIELLLNSLSRLG